jgi:hypothetical protein
VPLKVEVWNDSCPKTVKMKTKLKPLEVFSTMHPLFINYVDFANLVDQISYP